ncbi:MAG TPA: hypothetical protein VGL81_24080 [Polyangiaceae bacterium]|jgi:hypothetical protein
MLALFAVLGASAAVAYTVLLVRNTRLWMSSGTPWKALILHVGRTIGTVAVMVGFALAGTRPFLAALVGFACVHAVSLPLVRRLA